MKREGKANDSEILVARLIDRALRPLFPSDYHAEVYVTVNLISADKDIQPDALAGLAASAALAVSDIPFGGPISEVRVARIGGQYVINPAFSQMQDADLDIMVGGTIDNILMVEGEMKEVSEEVMLGAIKFAHEEIKKHCAVQIELSKELGKDVKRTYCHEVNDEELRQTIIRELYDKAYAIATSGTMKHEREDAFNALEAEFAARFSEEELVEKAGGTVAGRMAVLAEGDAQNRPDITYLGKLPVFGICLGNQVISMAAGADIEKLPYGHHGGNEPVMNLLTGKVEITAQNHNYGPVFPTFGPLVPELSDGVTEHPSDLRFWSSRHVAPVVMSERYGRIRLTHVNLNDGTPDGIQFLDLPAFSMQYHPEAKPGPNDSTYAFAAFARLMDGVEDYLAIDVREGRRF